MKSLRQIHTYLGCLFAPLILYFSLSGAWQVFRLNNLPKDEPATAVQSLLHEISKPHTSATLPGANPKTDSSLAFKCLSLGLGLGLAATTLIGITLALRTPRSKSLTLVCLGAGILLPLLFLLVH